MIPPRRTRRPCRKTASKRCRPLSEVWDLPPLRGEASASLLAPALENGATGPVLHPMAEAMLALPATVVRLIGAFHRKTLVYAVGECYEARFPFVKARPALHRLETGAERPGREEKPWCAKNTTTAFSTVHPSFTRRPARDHPGLTRRFAPKVVAVGAA